MRIPRIIYYIIYIIAFSFCLPLSALLIDKTMALTGYPTSLTEDFYPGRNLYQSALMVMPYVICHFIAAILTIKALSLKRLFCLSCIFGFIGQLFSFLTFDIWKVSILLHSACLIVGPLLPYVTPVLILAIINRKKSIKEAVSNLTNGVMPDAEIIDVQTQYKVRKNTSSLRERYWYVLDIILIVLIFLYGTLFDPFGLIAYVCGLYNRMGIRACMVFIFVGLFVPASLCILALFIRIFTTWPKHIKKKRRLRLQRLFVIAGLGIYLILPFTPLRPHGFRIYLAGFRKYIKANADIEGIRNWLGTLDPDDCVVYNITNARDGSKRSSPKHLEKKDWPDVITNIKPRYVRLSLDDNKLPKVRLNWGSGFLGSWGLVVGNENLPTPESDFSRHGEFRQQIREGAYIWHGMD